jgi:hypothetical protein
MEIFTVQEKKKQVVAKVNYCSVTNCREKKFPRFLEEHREKFAVPQNLHVFIPLKIWWEARF